MMEGGGREPVKIQIPGVSSPDLLIQQVLEVLGNLQLNNLPRIRTTYFEKRFIVFETIWDEQRVG